jgi:putative nucleotidyltransferase with HDIG domain
MLPTRDEALALLREYNKEDWHIRHALAVEAVMRHFARLLGEPDEEKWAVVGLLHDIDFEMFPGEHCVKAREILTQKGVDECVVHAVVSHGWGLSNANAKPEHRMEKVLYAVDEIGRASCRERV